MFKYYVKILVKVVKGGSVLYNIVIVEDHKLLRDMIKDSLENEEVFNVVATLSDAKDVFEVCKEYKPDLVLMDICTENNSNGIAYSKILKETFPEIKIIIMTGIMDINFVNEAKGELLVSLLVMLIIAIFAIILGNAIKKAVGDKCGIKRYGSCILPMDEVLVLCAIDLSRRPYLAFDAEFTTDRVGYFDTEMVKEFFYAISYTAGMNLHIKVLSGGNNHHMIEAMFKAFAKALDEATVIDPRITDVLTTKGSL